MRLLNRAILAVFCLPVAFSGLWGAMALWFRLPGSDCITTAASFAFAALAFWAALSLFRPGRRRWVAAYAVSFGALIIWWNTLVPPAEGNWSPEVARQVTGSIEGDVLTLRNMRTFDWRTEEDFTETWGTQSFDLSQIESVDLFMSYWAGPSMAHLMLSFGFADGTYLSWSAEVRRPVGKEFSPVADFFKSNSLVIVAGTEPDIVGLRSNIQMADVYMFRLAGDPARRRRLLEGYVESANRLALRPAFFHSLLTNCSMTVIQLARSLGADLPADWRVLVNGYFPEYLYELNAMNDKISFEELRTLGYISERARAQGLNEGFSQAIRMGVPSP